MDDIKIRKSTIEDMKQVEDAHRRSIREICSKDYNQEQIKYWSDVKYCPDIWKRTVLKEFHLVVEKNQKIEGMVHAAIRDNNIGVIAGLYFTPEITGKGYARKVIEQSLEYLKQNKCNKVIISGTITAKPFYERMGFRELSPRMINIRGVEVPCFKMEMAI